MKSVVPVVPVVLPDKPMVWRHIKACFSICRFVLTHSAHLAIVIHLFFADFVSFIVFVESASVMKQKKLWAGRFSKQTAAYVESFPPEKSIPSFMIYSRSLYF